MAPLRESAKTFNYMKETSLQDIFVQIEEIAEYFSKKLMEKDPSLNVKLDDFSLSKDEFYFNLSSEQFWSNWHYHFPLASLSLAPGTIYKTWNQENLAKEKASKLLTKEINRLKKTKDVKEYLKLCEAPF